MSMGYELALEIAGATIHAFESFGSYQGDWWAKVTYEGKTGWIHGSFGSCSFCDAFESEFDCSSHNCGPNRYHNPVTIEDFREGCSICEEIKIRLISFGKEYLSNIMTQKEAEQVASENLDWDMEAQEMVIFIKKHRRF